MSAPPGHSSKTASRRTLAKGAVWTTPVVSAVVAAPVVAAPVFAASGLVAPVVDFWFACAGVVS